MATYYVRSTDGSNADDGSTWALAKASLYDAAADGAAEVATGAGDIIYLSQAHDEVYTGTTVITFAGTAAAPTKVLCGNDAAEPPTAAAATAVVEMNGSAQSLYLYGRAHYHGITFKSGTSTGTSYVGVGGTTAPQSHVFESCKFELQNTSTSSRFNIGPTASTSNDDVTTEFWGCSFKTGSVYQGFAIGHGRHRFYGCSIDPAGQSPYTFLYPLPGTTVDVIFDSCDFSHLYEGGLLMDASVNASGRILLRNCIVAEGFTPFSGSADGYGSPELWMDGCNGLDVQNYMLRVSYAGTVQSEYTIYGDATDGTTPQSWSMASSANVTLGQPLRTPELLVYNTTTGSAVTVTVECLIDSATTLYNDELWLELEYPGTSGSACYTLDRSSRVADPIAARAECAAGAGTGAWTGEGGSAVSYKVTATVTPQEAGVLRARVALGKASATVYVNPKMSVA